MLTVVGALVRNLVVVIFLNALLEMMLPRGGFRRYIRLVTGLILVLMVVGTIAALLGKLPRMEPIIIEQSPIQVDRGEEQSEKAVLRYRQQVLQQCRDGLEKLLRDKINATGEWELIEAVLALDEERGSSTLGAPRQINLLVRESSAAAERVKPVSIDPVKVGQAKKNDEEIAVSASPKRLPGLERSLAALLELPPERVTVAVAERGLIE